MKNLRTKLLLSSTILCFSLFTSCGGGGEENVSSTASPTITTASGSIYDAFIKGLKVCPEGDPNSTLCNQTDELGRYTIKNYNGGNLDVYLNTENGSIYLGTIPSSKVNNKIIKPTDFIFNGTENETIGLDLAIYLENLAQTCTTNSSVTTWDFSSFNSSACSDFLPPEKNFYKFWEKSKDKLIYCLDASSGNGTSFTNCMEDNSTVIDETKVKTHRLMKKIELENSNPETLIESVNKLAFFKTEKELTGNIGNTNYTLTIKPTEIKVNQISGTYEDTFGNGTFKVLFPFLSIGYNSYYDGFKRIALPSTTTAVTFINYPMIVLKSNEDNSTKSILIHTITDKGFVGLYIENLNYEENPKIEKISLSTDGSPIEYQTTNGTELVNLLNLVANNSYYRNSVSFTGGKISYYRDDDIIFYGSEGVAQDIDLSVNNTYVGASGQGLLQVNNGKYYSDYDNISFYYYYNGTSIRGNGTASFTFTPDMTFQIPCLTYMANSGMCKENSNFILFISGNGYLQISCDNETIQNVLNQANNQNIYGIWGSSEAYGILGEIIYSVIQDNEEPELIPE